MVWITHNRQDMNKNTMKERVRSTIYPNGQGKIQAQDHQDLLLDMVEEIYSQNGEGKADVDGTYPDMTAGYAQDLVGHGESAPAEFTFRASGGKSIKDGNATIKELQGNAAEIDGALVPFRGEAIKSVGDNAWDEQWDRGVIVRGEDYDLPGYIRSRNYIPILGGEDYHYANKEQALDDYLNLFFYDKDKVLIDSYPWSIGTFPTPANARYMRFYVNDTYGDVYKNDIIITLVHSGWKVEDYAEYQPYWADILPLGDIMSAFPDGMMRAGDACDKAYNKNGKGYTERHIRAVRLGDLIDAAQATAGCFFFSGLPYAPATDRDNASLNITAAGYESSLAAYGNITEDKTICIAEGRIWVSAREFTQYSSPEEFLAAHGDTLVYYAVEDPDIIEHDHAFRMTYRVADFGTEELISEQLSAPFRARTIYQFNAVDQIRENSERIARLEALVASLNL